MLIPKMYVFISLPWIFVELHFKSRRFHVNFDYFTIWTNSDRNIRPISENIANWSLFAFSSFFLNRFSQKWRPLYGQKWQMAALNSIRMTNLDKSGPEALCDVIFRLSPYSWGGGHRKGHFIIVFRASVANLPELSFLWRMNAIFMKFNSSNSYTLNALIFAGLKFREFREGQFFGYIAGIANFTNDTALCAFCGFKFREFRE